MKEKILKILNKYSDYDLNREVDVLNTDDYRYVVDEIDALFAKRKVGVTLKEKEETDFEIKSLRDLKEAYPDGTNYTIRGFGKLIMYFVDNEEVYVKHL